MITILLKSICMKTIRKLKLKTRHQLLHNFKVYFNFIPVYRLKKFPM